MLNDVVDEGDAFRLSNVGCPCRSTAQETDAACEADRYSIELLLGVPVEQVSTIAGGSSCCEYLVRKTTDETAPSGEALGAALGEAPLAGLAVSPPELRVSGSGMRARVELQ